MSPRSPELSYFAILDPLPGADGAPRVTLWAKNNRHRKHEPRRTYRAWPPKSDFPGPRWNPRALDGFMRGTPSHYAERTRLSLLHWEATRAYWAAVEERIEADLAEAAARFARLASRCVYCGRDIWDAESKSYGVGSECRSRLPAGELARQAEGMRSLYATAGQAQPEVAP